MKQTSILFLVLFSFTIGFAQSPRTVLLEHFTQASCGPCATFNPAVENYLNTTNNRMISLKYQASFPGSDPMYTFSKTYVDNRQSYYGVNSVPRSVIDGNIHNGAPITSTGGWTDATITNRNATTSPFDIEMDYSVREGFDSVLVSMTVTASQDYTGSILVGHIVVVEKHISFCKAPGSNGELDFFYVLKRMLPSPLGTTLPSTWTNGQSETIEMVWAGSSAYNPGEFAVIGFVQENNGKEILQAGIKEDYVSPHQVEVMNIGVSGSERCDRLLTCTDGIFTPSVEIANLGSEEITSVEIEYSLVGGTTDTYTWTGNLASFEKTSVSLPDIASTVTSGTQNINTSIISVNGVSDDLAGNNNNYASGKVENFSASPSLTLELTTDQYGTETTWAVKKVSDGTTAYSGGPYNNVQSGTTVQTPVTMSLDPTECYYFEIFDAYGDGICCGYGNGSFRVYDDQGYTLAQGGSFGDEFVRAFTTTMTSGIEDVIETTSFNVYPNPIDTEVATVEFSVKETSNVSIRVHSLLGDLIMEKDLGSRTSGMQQEILELPAVGNGVYMITLVVDNEVLTKKVTVLK